METILIKVAQFFLSLSILVVLHELGHFTFAKIFKTRVEKFYIFFNPWFSLFKFKWRETEYGIGWLPLGGYVKISGMIDESMDKEQMKKPPQPWEFRAKPAWQRLLILLGGILVNILLAFVIYIGVLWAWGEEYLPTDSVKYGIMTDSTGLSIGLQNGDKILYVDGKKIEDFNKIPAAILLDEPKSITVIRNGEEVQIPLDKSVIAKVIDDPYFLAPRIPFVVAQVLDTSSAAKAGIKPGDKVIAVNDNPAMFVDEVKKYLSENKGNSVELTILRGNDTLTVPVKVNEQGMIGVALDVDYTKYFKLKHIDYSLWQAIPAGLNKTIKATVNYLKQLKIIFSPETKAYKNVGGFISIGKIFPGVWDWRAFWNLTAFLSIMLAVLNLIPIPGLDGGHVLFTLYEMITGRKPSDKFLERAQIVGLIILLAIILFANGNDIVKLFNGK
jgi:regulator of sigma E protease